MPRSVPVWEKSCVSKLIFGFADFLPWQPNQNKSLSDIPSQKGMKIYGVSEGKNPMGMNHQRMLQVETH